MSPPAPVPESPTPPLRATGEGCLFVLDDEGVFFSPARQELYVFNTSATFVWCLVEAGATAEEVVTSYAQAFGVGLDEAQANVADILDRWWGAGYVDKPALTPKAPLPFASALARLLVNRELRAAFADDRAAVARDLRIAPPERDAFVALDPAALDAQADRMRDRHTRRTVTVSSADNLWSTAVDGARTPLDLAAKARLRSVGTPIVERVYRMLETSFRIRFAATAQERLVHSALAHLEIGAHSDDDVIYDVVETEAGHVVLEAWVPRGYCRRLEELTPIVKALMSQSARHRARYFLEIHAGVVSTGDVCILLPGPSGSGKSTLTLGLALAGFAYFSDEVALLDEVTLEVRPFPLGLALKPGSISTIASALPQAGSIDAHHRDDGRKVRYLSPGWLGPMVADVPVPARWLIFPAYSPGARTELRPIARSEALRRLLQECTTLPELLDSMRVEQLVRWMRTLACYELPMSSLDEGVALVRHCVASG
jgi:hypothetical protein